MNMNTMPQQVNTGGDMPMNVSQTLNHLILEAAQSQLNTQHMMQNMQMPLLQNDAPFISMPQTSVSPFNDMRDSCKLISNSEINKIILVFLYLKNITMLVLNAATVDYLNILFIILVILPKTGTVFYGNH